MNQLISGIEEPITVTFLPKANGAVCQEIEFAIKNRGYQNGSLRIINC